MTFEVIPAIDAAGGRLVRMSRDGATPVEAFGGDPIAAAEAFVRAGARRLHVVDVDLAVTGEVRNLDLVRSIASLGVPVQASGGVSTAAQAELLLAAGAGRVVLGSAALADRTGTERALAQLGERLCVGLEADGPTLRPRGGGRELPLWDTLAWLGGLDVPRYLLTEVGRVGGSAGPDLDGIRAIASRTERPVLAAGGIRSVGDLLAVARLGGTVEGAVVGRAFHEGLDLSDVLASIGGERGSNT
ncbi:MAG TPA: HisA/HisF-related TIM barrel protein [Actinomycetota bacterium]|nr:HisA/HisF-related TIM barrel protein [Actinomycetota bacterium]